MNALLSVIRNIALLVLISSFWELLVPRGSLRGPVRLVIGLLLVAAVVQPLTDALARGSAPWQLKLPESGDFGVEEAISQGQELAGGLESAALTRYETDMSRQVASMCLLNEQVTAARAAVSAAGGQGGQLNHITVEAELVPGAESGDVTARLTQMISTFFAIDEHDIECRIKEAEADGGEESTGEQ